VTIGYCAFQSCASLQRIEACAKDGGHDDRHLLRSAVSVDGKTWSVWF
jgi:hypothetical protein